MKSFALAALTALVCGGTALAAQNVANTSQKGSLLIFPLINIDPAEQADTLIEISNDAPRAVKIECYYVNEKKGRVDFDFRLTGKQTVSWSVATLAGDQVQPAAFPTGGPFNGGGRYPPTNAKRGELVCFATNEEVTAQIAWNHLSGTAIVSGSNGSIKYNAWSFVARNANGLPEANNVVQGTPGFLRLTGAGAGTYDACPVYNIAKFMPNGAALGTIQTHRNVLTVVSCNQDLRQDYRLYLTKLQFTVWNSFESSFTGAYICVDSVHSVHLGAANTFLENGANFEGSVLRTPNARFQVSGVASTQCPDSRASALLGVLSSRTNRGDVGNTTHSAGTAPGFVLWDPFVDAPHKIKN
jgi:hypothetical protein